MTKSLDKKQSNAALREKNEFINLLNGNGTYTPDYNEVKEHYTKILGSNNVTKETLVAFLKDRLLFDLISLNNENLNTDPTLCELNEIAKKANTIANNPLELRKIRQNYKELDPIYKTDLWILLGNPINFNKSRWCYNRINNSMMINGYGRNSKSYEFKTLCLNGLDFDSASYWIGKIEKTLYKPRNIPQPKQLTKF